jgi:hypothetical protein
MESAITEEAGLATVTALELVQAGKVERAAANPAIRTAKGRELPKSISEI